MLKVRVGGIWLHTFEAYGGLSFSHVYPHGSDTVQFEMLPGATHPSLIGGALVEVFDGGIRIWLGNLQEPGTGGAYTARGSWGASSGVLALDGSGNATNIPDTAIDAAIARGAVPWTRPASLSAVAWGTAAEPLGLLQLLDEAFAGSANRWLVDADGKVKTVADPTTPDFVVPRAAAGFGLTLAEDDYFSHLVGMYLSGVSTYATVTYPVGATVASARWGRKEGFVDLTPMGVLTAPNATTEVTNRFNQVGARLTFAESLTLSYGQITTLGGTPATLTQVRAGHLVRLMGVRDRRFATAELPYTDIVVGQSSYTVDPAPQVQISPLGKAPRNFAEVMKVAVA